jgi:hypothetical protein
MYRTEQSSFSEDFCHAMRQNISRPLCNSKAHSLPSSPHLATISYFEPGDSTVHLNSLLLPRFLYYSPFMAMSSKSALTLRFSMQAFPNSHVDVTPPDSLVLLDLITLQIFGGDFKL